MLGKAEWPLLKKADFSLRLGWGPSWELLFSPSFSAACLVSSVLGVSGPRCFWENGEGAEGLLGALCRCRELEDAGGGAWGSGSAGCFTECFTGHRRRLCRASGPRLPQDIDFSYCGKIPESAWAALSEGVWPVLRNAEGIPEEHLIRLQRGHLRSPGPGPSSSASVAVWLSDEVLCTRRQASDRFSRETSEITCWYRSIAC